MSARSQVRNGAIGANLLASLVAPVLKDGSKGPAKIGGVGYMRRDDIHTLAFALMCVLHIQKLLAPAVYASDLPRTAIAHSRAL